MTGCSVPQWLVRGNAAWRGWLRRAAAGGAPADLGGTSQWAAGRPPSAECLEHLRQSLFARAVPVRAGRHVFCELVELGDVQHLTNRIHQDRTTIAELVLLPFIVT